MRLTQVIGAIAVGVTLVFAAQALISPQLTAQSTDALIGIPSVIDADTLDLHGDRIRLHGIDAPEGNQLCQLDGKPYRCGQQAALALDDLIGGRTVRCDQRDRDRYGRVVSECFRDDINLNAWLVENGHALAYRAYSSDYVAFEEDAQLHGRGMWAGEFTAPWDYRRGLGEIYAVPEVVGAEVSDAGDACVIKGNISSSGERIYHALDSPWYERTIIDTGQGERWFCTEAEAVAAGWRRAGQR